MAPQAITTEDDFARAGLAALEHRAARSGASRPGRHDGHGHQYHRLPQPGETIWGWTKSQPCSASESRLADLSDAILTRFKSDARCVMPGGSFGVGEPNGDGTFVDGYGIVRALPDERGHWYVVGTPLTGEITRHDVAVAAQTWPDPTDPVYTDGVAERARALHQETDCAVILNLPLGVIHIAQWLRGFENWLMDLVLDPEFSIYFLDLLLERWLEVVQRLLEAVGDNIDILFFAEDIAFHNGSMVSPKTYQRIIRPYQSRLFRALHDWSDAKILYHNCGSVTWQIPDMIEWGIDALNPVQVNSDDMGDTASLKQRFGDKITFWGAVDTSHVLPHGTPQDVRDEVHRRISDLNQDGGYVLGDRTQHPGRSVPGKHLRHLGSG